MGVPATPPPPPEAQLVRLVREAAGLSAESAAARVESKLSGSRWRQIERGYRGDLATTVVAPDKTLAQMCHALGITPDRLAATGRAEAAHILEEMQRSEAEPAPASPEAASVSQLPVWQQEVILRVLDERPRSRYEKALLLRTLAAKLEEAEDAQAPGNSSTKQESPGRSA
jgi:transcriptional regulator with XRE-family HTH domain